MKKLLFALPAFVLLVVPTAALAHDNNRGGSPESFEHRQDIFHRNPISTSSAKNHDNDNDEAEEHAKVNVNIHVKSGDNTDDSDEKAEVNLKIHGIKPATGSATASAFANIHVKGPVDQVVQILQQIIDFLKGLV